MIYPVWYVGRHNEVIVSKITVESYNLLIEFGFTVLFR